MAEIQYYELDGKFWEIQIEGTTTATRYGKLDTNGQTRSKDHPNEEKARAFFDKTILSKTKKGYSEADRPEDAPESLIGDAPAPKSRKRAAPAKAAPAKRAKRTEGGSGVLDGLVFALTGTLSEKRAAVVAKIEGAGGSVASTLTKKVTHLLMGRGGEGTSKHDKAVDRGDIEILSEEELTTMLGGDSSGAEEKVSARAARAAKKANKTPAQSQDGPLSGMVICSTGTVSKTRKAMTAMIEAHGGSVASSMTKKVTHLLLGEGGEGTSKHDKAIERDDVEIITEDELEALIGGSPMEEKEPEPEGEDEGEASGDEPEEEPEEKTGGKPLAGMVICVTGTLSAKRAVFEKKIRTLGGKTAGSVTKACTHLLMGDDGEGSSKHTKALANGIPVWDEATFNATIGA